MDFSAALVLIYNLQSPLNYSFMFLSFLKPLTVLLCLSACPGESVNSSGTTVRHTRMHTCACAHRRARRDTALDSSAWQRLVTHETPSESVDSELPRWEASQLVTLSCALPGDEGGERGETRLWRSRSVQRNRAPIIALSPTAEQECTISCGGHSAYGLWVSSALHSLDSPPLTTADVPFYNCP